MIGHATCANRLPICSDLSEAAVEDAIEILKASGQTATVLVARKENSFEAGVVAQQYGLKCILLPDEIMQRDSWAVVGQYSYVWSPGA